MTNDDQIAILDFGGQYAHLIANRIRRIGAHAVIEDHDAPAEDLKKYKGLILSGGPQSVNGPEAVLADPAIFELGIPVLGICYGHQVTNKVLGGTISPGTTKEYGKTQLTIDKFEGIFKDIDNYDLDIGHSRQMRVWMSHWDEVTEIPVDFQVLAHTDINDFAAVGNLEKHIYGIQFHPEVTHTEQGQKILENFVNITGAEKTWDTAHYLPNITEEVKEQVAKAGRKVFMLVSGGVDSVVAFTLLNKVLGKENVIGLLVDTGFMRKGEVEEVMSALKAQNMDNLHVADAKQEFYDALKDISDPEEKRAIIGKKFLEIQANKIHELGLDPEHYMLGQGTIYPDTIESGTTKNADKIKTHHNRVPEIQAMIEKGLVIEPLEQLYKDEVRQLGEALGLPHHLVWRHPFPGPGLAIRMLCTGSDSENSKIDNSKIQYEEKQANQYLKNHGIEGTILPIQSVGVQGDARTYRHPIAIWPTNGDWESKWNKEELQEISTKLTNEFESINRVIFSLSKPLSPESSVASAKDGSSHSFSLIPNCYLSPGRVATLQEADKIVMDSIMAFDDQEKTVWQCPTVLLPIGIKNDQEPESEVSVPRPSNLDQEPQASSLQPQAEALLLRPVSSIDAMTADFTVIPKEELKKIIEELEKLKPSAIFFDLTNKPPGTIEWE
jgi:GMP synthase (glutamine-hydrolysing)